MYNDEKNEKMIMDMVMMQRELDMAIYDNLDLDYRNDYQYNKVYIALITEVGELMNELPTIFKYWKKTAVDNREKALVELVDCWHFVLSYVARGCVDFGNIRFSLISLMRFKERFDKLDCKIGNIDAIIGSLTSNVNLTNILQLTYALGFTLEEVYECYMVKNKENYTRIANGY